VDRLVFPLFDGVTADHSKDAQYSNVTIDVFVTTSKSLLLDQTDILDL